MYATIDEAFEAHVARRVDHAVQRALEIAKNEGDETAQCILELVKTQRDEARRTLEPVEAPRKDEVAQNEAMAQHALQHVRKLMSINPRVETEIELHKFSTRYWPAHSIPKTH